MFDILVAGEINPDLVLTGDVEPEFGQVEKLLDSARLTVGSSSAIFACGAARLGLKVAFIGVCGNDVFGRFMLEEMQKRHVDTSPVIVRDQGQTGITVILNRQTDRAIFTHLGLIPALTAEDVTDKLLQGARHLHVASYFLQTGLQADLADVFLRAHAGGLSTSLDTNYDPSERWQGLAALLPHVDIFLPNEAEALAIAHASEAQTAAKRLAEEAGLVVVKLGARGALACTDDEITRAESIAVSVTDSIGAGDAFDAGFLFGFLNRWVLGRSLRLACACGALSMREAGGTEGQPALDEAMQYVPG
jgi:sugar/nucleoside kinase (ribokinase family)